MLIQIAFALGVLTQSAPSPSGDRRSGDPGVRVWVSDTLYQVGAGARVYVRLREPGYLVVLHIDAMGRIRVLYPETPADQAVVPAGAPFEVAGTGDSGTFRIETRGRGTLLAARTLHAFEFEPLRRGARWDYAESLLLQPSAGNAFAALLDIADRVADEQPYDYDVTAYGTPLAGRAAADTVCFSCLTKRRARASPAEPGSYGNGALAIDHSYAAANNSSVVDCSGANLVNSFCGVQDNSVTSSYADYSTYEANTNVYPIYEPFFFRFRRFVRDSSPPPPPPRPAITLPTRLRPASRRLVPPPVRERPRFVVVQPTAPSRPDRGSVAFQAEPAAASPAPARHNHPARVARTVSATSGAAGAVMRQSSGTPMMPSGVSVGAPAPVTRAAAPASARAAGSTTRASVPSRAVLRSINARH